MGHASGLDEERRVSQMMRTPSSAAQSDYAPGPLDEWAYACLPLPPWWPS